MKKCGIFFLFLIGGLIGMNPAFGAETVGKIVAIVNDEVITQQELEEALPAFSSGTSDTQESHRQKVLNRLVEDKLILQVAKAKGLSVTEAELEETIKKVKNHFPSEEAFQKSLADTGFSYKEFEKRHEEQLLVRKSVTMEVRAKSNATPKEIETYYQNHPEEFEGGEAWHFTALVVRKKAPPREDPVAKKLALNLLTRARRREDFTALTKEYEKGPRKVEIKDMGFVERGKLVKEVEGVLFRQSAGDISDPVETSSGYHLFRLDERRPAVLRPFKEVKGQIRDRLLQEKIKKRYEAWITQLKKDAYIKQE